ncbi:MAG: MFS transporter [Dehalococcoidales bacterium]|nr:MFS transporter [Dehalococcoidales bacterium]
MSKIFYGYIIIAASLLILIIMHGIGSTYGVFFSSLQQEFGSNRATIAGASSLAFFLEGLFAIPIGRLTDRFGPRVVIAGCGLIFGLGYFLMSRVGSLWQLYLFYPVIVGFGISSGNVALMSTATRWFVKRRGLMTGIVKVGTGAGMFIVPLVASWLILGYGWRNAYLVLSIIGVVGIVAIAQFLKRDPSQMGLQPYGMYDANGTISELAAHVQLSLRDTMRTRQFWALCAVYLLVTYTAQSVMIHIIPYAVDSGITITQAASIVSVIGAVSIPGRLAMGSTGDKLGNRRALIICFIIVVAALSWLQLAKGLWMLYLFAIVYGFAHGGFFAIMSPLVAELFGTTSHGVNLGMVLFLGHIGGALGPVVTGRIFDVAQSYQLAFAILIAAGVGALTVTITQLNPVQVNKPSAIKGT